MVASLPPALVDVHQLATDALRLRPVLCASARRAFPRMPSHAVDDAFAALLHDLAARPERYHAAAQRGHFEALCSTVVRRALRGEWRRKAWRAADPVPTEAERGGAELADARPSAEEHLARARAPELTAGLIQRAARHACRRRAEAVARALTDFLHGDDSLSEAALRHGVPREYLSLCLRYLRSAPLADVDALRSLCA